MLMDFVTVRNFVETESFEFDPVVLVDLISLVNFTSFVTVRVFVEPEPLEPEEVVLVLSANAYQSEHLK
jgi:hypothetical protein